MPETSISDRRLVRELTFLEALTMGIGGIIGGGIFSVVGIVLNLAGPAVIISFFLCTLTAIMIGYNYVRLGGKFPYCGGSYQYISEAFPKKKFVKRVSGQILWLGYIVACSLYGVSFGLYANYFFPFIPSRIFSIILIFLLVALNFMGVGKTGRAQNVIVIAKVLILSLFIVIGSFFIDSSNFTPFFSEGYSSIFLASSLIFISFQGFEIISTASEELKDPEKNLGRAIYGSIVVGSILYFGVAAVSIGTIYYKGLGESGAPLAEVATNFLGSRGGLILGFGGLLSTSSALNAALFGASRLAFSMSNDGELPRIFSHLNRKTRVPALSLIVTGIIIALFTSSGLIWDLSGLASLIFLVIFMMVCLSNLRLRAVTDSKAPLIASALFLSIYFMLYVDMIVWLRFIIFLLAIIIFNLLFQFFKKQ